MYYLDEYDGFNQHPVFRRGDMPNEMYEQQELFPEGFTFRSGRGFGSGWTFGRYDTGSGEGGGWIQDIDIYQIQEHN